MRRFPSLVALWFAIAATLAATEVQSHGLIFEKWVRDTFFAGYVPPNYTQKWDIPASANRAHGGLPVNPKAAKYGTAVDLGDALRQFDIDEPFILVIGYWRQEGGQKRFVHIVAATITPEQWRGLWGSLTRADLEKLDALIKDRTRSPAEVRRQAQALKRTAPYRDSVITLNPKIDSRGQRRLQCSLSFASVFKHLAPEADRRAQIEPSLWGVPCPVIIESAPRTFSKSVAPAP